MKTTKIKILKMALVGLMVTSLWACAMEKSPKMKMTTEIPPGIITQE